MEFKRNNSRYQFLKWGMQAFDGFRVIPPGIGICHQVNLEYLAQGVWEKFGVYYPDSVVGTDSHTTMINGLAVVGWGVGGIEAEAAMLGQPVYFLTPDVVGVHMSGQLREGVTATDLVLAVTEMLRKAKVVGKFVEFHGDGAASLSVVDRATIANMSPEYGATMGYFPPDEQTCAYLKATGREDAQVDAVCNYFKAQGMFGMPRKGEIEYSTLLELDLDTIVPSVAGPKRPQDRIPLPELEEQLHQSVAAGRKVRRLRQALRRNQRALRRGHRRVSARCGGCRRRRTAGDDGASARLSRNERERHQRERHERLDGNGNGQQPSDARPHCRSLAGRVSQSARRSRSRRRFDRGDHFVHEHFESERDAGGRTAREESGRDAD